MILYKLTDVVCSFLRSDFKKMALPQWANRGIVYKHLQVQVPGLAAWQSVRTAAIFRSAVFLRP